MSRRKAKKNGGEKATQETGTSSTGTKDKPRGADAVARVRTRVAQVVWLFFLFCALLLAVGALLVALDANARNPLVEFVLDGADAVDLGIFSRENGIKEFKGENAEVKNALFNWGLGAVAYLVVGRVLDRLIRP